MKKIIMITTFLLTQSCSTLKLEHGSEKQLRSTISNLKDELDSTKSELLKLNGKIEDIEHFTNKKIELNNEENLYQINKLKEDLIVIKSFQETQKILNSNIESLIMNDKSLSIKADSKSNFREDKIDNLSKSQIDKASEHFSKKQYNEALNIYSYFLDKAELLTQEEYQILLYRVALSEYRLEINEASLVHFSQLYDKFHKKNDKYMASSLFHIGSLLIKSSKCTDAREVFEQITIQYSHKYFKDEATKRIKLIDNSLCSLPNKA